MADSDDRAQGFSEEHLCLIAKGTLDNLPYFVQVVSIPEYQLVFINQGLIDLLAGFGVHVSPDDLGKHPWDVFPNWKETYLPYYEEVRRTAKVLSFRNIRHVLNDHVTYWDVAFVPDKDEAGNVTSIASVRIENTDRRIAEETQSRLAAIVQSSSEAIIGKTLEGIVTSWNKGAEQIYGYTADEVIGQSISILVPPDNPDEITQILDRVRRGERVEHYETERITKSGERICVSLSVSPIVDASGVIAGAATIARDITAVKDAERDREALVWHLQERAKELQCLYQITSLTQLPNIAIEELLTRAVAMLPAAWEYPDIAAARIVYDGKEYATPNFVETPWILSANMSADGVKMGEVSVCYLEERTLLDEGPFLREERFVLETVGRNLGSSIEHKLAHQREEEADRHKRDFYRRTILAATGGKLEITDIQEIQEIAKQPIGEWVIENGADVGRARVAVTTLAESFGMDGSKLDDFVLCVGEAITNAFKHAAGGIVSLYWLADAVLLVVSDHGPGIEALALPEIALRKGYTTAVSLGMGYKMMISLADKVYLATEPAGTTVAIRMDLHEQPKVPAARLMAEAWSF